MLSDSFCSPPTVESVGRTVEFAHFTFVSLVIREKLSVLDVMPFFRNSKKKFPL